MTRVLCIAYACEPDRGSEPAVGWNTTLALSERLDVIVLTRANNRAAIEGWYAEHPEVRPPVYLYHDPPAWMTFWKRGQRGVQLYYYLWQLTAISRVRSACAEMDVDLVQHVSFVKYWAPSAGAFAHRPFVWGPVGGGERIPRGMWSALPRSARFGEWLRVAVQTLAEFDPLVRRTARHASVSLATTKETAERLQALHCRDVRVIPAISLPLAGDDGSGPAPMRREGARFASVGRLEAWKGFQLGVEAFCRADIPGATFDVIGSGHMEGPMRDLARKWGKGDAVVFSSNVPRAQLLERMRDSVDVLVHPSLHDSGGMVVLEAARAGKPVVAIDAGGPGEILPQSEFLVEPGPVSEVVERLASAMTTLAENPAIAASAGLEAMCASEQFLPERLAEKLLEVFADVLSAPEVTERRAEG